MSSSSDAAARDACETLSRHYAEYADGWQIEKFAQLFTPDGIFDRLGTPLVGRQAIADFMANRPRDVWQKHRNSNFQFELGPDGKTATGSLDVDMDRGRIGESEPTSVLRARYSDRFVLTAEGWRFAMRAVSLRESAA